jgi:hypothetical protein
MQLKNIITKNQSDIAFIVGNGINRFPNNPKAISWDTLLMKLWTKFSPDSYKEVPRGITTTEFYDLLDIAISDNRSTNFQIQKEASQLLSDWKFQNHHTAFVRKALDIDAPILTTNFDLILPTCLGLKQFYTDTKAFTDFYPWTTYYGNKQLNYPTDGFGIWFINGFVKYHRSIRLGLSHYMGSVEKARNFLHKGDERKLFSGKNQDNWRGSKTWLHIIFNKSLCIFGLGLEENEVFIRWLLIERAKYFKKFPERAKSGWYVAPRREKPDDRDIGKIKFLEGIGFKLIETNDYTGIYESPWD